MTGGRLLAFAWRESRFARRRLLLFLSAISLGVAALVAVRGLSAALEEGVRAQARGLLGGDLAFRARQPFGPGTERMLDSLRAEGVPVARVISFATMALAPRTGGTRLVQIRAAEPGFPYYGEIETAPAGVWEELQAGRNVLVDPGLLVALGAGVGDSLAIGETRFRIVGVLEKVPGDVEIASAFAPRVYLPASRVGETGLLGFGSRVEYEAFLRLPDAGEIAALREARGPLFEEERVRTRTAAEQQENLGESLGRLTRYLGLVGVFALLLGGIGVASAMGAYMAQKADTVAVLRCLGATARQVFSIYLVQAALMGLAGAIVGVAMGLAAQWVLPRLLAGLLPVELEAGVHPGVITAGIGVGVWTAVAFALLPLLDVRRVPPLGALRRKVEPIPGGWRDRARWAGWGALALSVLGIVSLQAGSLRLGLSFTGGIAAVLLLLWLLAAGVVWVVRRLRTGALPYVARQGVAGLHRPGNQTRSVVLALGFGVFLLGTLFLVQHNLLRPLTAGSEGTRANLLLWNVQADQMRGVGEILGDEGSPVLQRAPIVPMRLAAIGDRRVDRLRAGEGGPERWAVHREYRSTFRDTLVSSERLVEGEPWARAPDVDGAYPVSLEVDIAADLGVGVGDRLTWDVQGVEIPTVVTSLRKVDWARFEPNFFAVFPTRALEAAPHTWVLLTRAGGADERARVQGRIVRRFPNVSALDLTQLQAALDEVLARVSAAIRFLALFSIATGFVVLLGAVATTRLQRVREAVLLKTLGAVRLQVVGILATEYFLLGLLASLTGAALALGGGWALSRWLFDVDFAVPARDLLTLGGAVTLLAIVVGVWGSREVFRQTPLAAIREE